MIFAPERSYAGKSLHPNHGQRVVIRQRIVLLAAPCCVPPLDNGGDVFEP
jgi:hypothetical protein